MALITKKASLKKRMFGSVLRGIVQFRFNNPIPAYAEAFFHIRPTFHAMKIVVGPKEQEFGHF